MATREITDEQAGEIAERLRCVESHVLSLTGWKGWDAEEIRLDLAEIRRLLGFPA